MSEIIFILGAPRSGTTLLQKSLNCHSKIYGGPEFDHLNQIIKLYNYLEKKNKTHRQAAYYDTERLKKQFRLFFENLIGHKESIICEKTPSNTLITKEIRKLYPSSKFLVILRDPRAIFSSYKDVGKTSKINFGLNSVTTINSITNYLKSIQYILDKDEHTHVIYYEDLIKKNRETIEKVCHFLNVDFEISMTNPVNTNDDIDKLVRKKGVNEMPFITSSYGRAITDKNINKWKTKLSNHEINLVNQFVSKTSFQQYIEKYEIPKTTIFNRVKLLPFITLSTIHSIYLGIIRKIRFILKLKYSLSS